MAQRRKTVKQITMQELYRRAKKDPEFFEAFLKNPRTALDTKGLALPEHDLKDLEREFRKVHKIGGKDLARVLVGGKAMIVIVPWPNFRPWPIFTPVHEEPEKR